MENKGAFDINIDDEHLTIDYVAKYQFDGDYGADLDGKKGTHQVFLEDIQINYILDSYGNDILEKIEKDHGLYSIIEDEIINYEGKKRYGIC